MLVELTVTFAKENKPINICRWWVLVFRHIVCPWQITGVRSCASLKIIIVYITWHVSYLLNITNIAYFYLFQSHNNITMHNSHWWHCPRHKITCLKLCKWDCICAEVKLLLHIHYILIWTIHKRHDQEWNCFHINTGPLWMPVPYNGTFRDGQLKTNSVQNYKASRLLFMFKYRLNKVSF